MASAPSWRSASSSRRPQVSNSSQARQLKLKRLHSTRVVAASASSSAPSTQPLRVVIAGGGICGGLILALLRNHIVFGEQEDNATQEIHIRCFERTPKGKGPPGLNLLLNANGVATLSDTDTELADAVKKVGLEVRRWSARDMTGNVMYDIHDAVCDGLADGVGLRTRWDDVQRTIRQFAPQDAIEWDADVVGYEYKGEGSSRHMLVNVLHKATNVEETVEADILIATDGRYSRVRAQVEGGELPAPHVLGVSDFRVLVPDTTGGAIDDLVRVYNAPDVDNLATRHPNLASDPTFEQVCMRGIARVGAMRIPAVTGSVNSEGDLIGIFGNVRIPRGGQLPDIARTSEAMRALFTPKSGESSLDEIGRFVLDSVVEHADEMHWERFQEVLPRMLDDKGQVLLLGDAAHAFCPSLGQGANMAIEDACVAASMLLSGVKQGASASQIAAAIAARRLPRVTRVGELSAYHAEHLEGPGGCEVAMQREANEWLGEGDNGVWRSSLRWLWSGWPRRHVSTVSLDVPMQSLPNLRDLPDPDPEVIAVNDAEVERASTSVPLVWEKGLDEWRYGRRRAYVHEPTREDRVVETKDGALRSSVSIFRPSEATAARGCYLQVHGGCFCFGDSGGQNDPRLQELANEHGLVVVSVDYPLVPESSHAQAVDAVQAALQWLALEGGADELGMESFGGICAGGESAGANLLLCALVRMRDSGIDVRAMLKSVNLVYGWYDLSLSDSTKNWGERRLMTNTAEYEWHAKLTCGSVDAKDPSVSPIYSDLSQMPPALFSVGTEDALVDDTLRCFEKFRAAGNEASVHIWPGAPHGVGHFGPHASTPLGMRARRATEAWVCSFGIEGRS
ncbi:hypothetical protein PPROV_000757400 [Pycnococcus provasolii]|uniref:Alpha/beta hydrolase fold-3 domain-containing protein n=1 Tax=Pycnococcus provasolii TaxID=41880 RepID=A0A830HV79_9CHLO|nr:hypothetical protein PPROV_000757400 [Pycnococcus provasolii]